MYTEQAEVRFWGKVQLLDPTACWNWTGSVDKAGYGQLYLAGKQRKAHRVAWQLENMEPIPDGMEVCHRCDNRRCCNPAHLWLGTHQQNMNDAVTKRRLGRHGKGFESHPENIMRGERHWNSRLTEEQVVRIRQQAASGASRKSLAAEYGVTQIMVGHIITGRSWKDASGPTDATDRRVGGAHWKAVLTSEDVRNIRRQASSGISQVVLAESFGVSQGNISAIVRRKSWAHLPEE
jgi:DNA-binding transcriptional regulator YiaG